MLKIEELKKSERKLRRPRHTFYLKQKAYGLQPFMIAPVLPGETLTNLLLQSRVVTDPIKQRLIGWHAEYWLFYVKITDLDGADDFKDMMLDPDKSMAAYQPTASVPQYHTYDDTIGGVDWVRYCLKRVTETFFREQGEAWDVVMHETNIPGLGLNSNSWLDSVIKSSAFDTTDVPTTDFDSYEKSRIVWEQLMAQQLINMDYEDFLRSYGISRTQAAQANNEPELIRYVREWEYPSNTINASTGAATSAVSWVIQDRADKPRFFNEPGFIFGVCTQRPKLYMSNMRSSIATWMSRAQDWFPAIMRDDPFTSMREFDDAEGPLAGMTGGAGNDYWVDLRDALVHGDQFVNFDISTGSGSYNDVELPGTALTHAAKFYPTEAMIDSLYVTAGTDYVYQDGVVQLAIKGTQEDHT